jgi:transposase
MHLAWRWFTGLGFDQEIPHHSTFSKNRHGRFLESNLFQELFERIVDQCIRAGLVQGERMSVVMINRHALTNPRFGPWRTHICQNRADMGHRAMGTT